MIKKGLNRDSVVYIFTQQTYQTNGMQDTRDTSKWNGNIWKHYENMEDVDTERCESVSEGQTAILTVIV